VLARRLLPVVTLAVIGDDMRNVISGPGITGRYVVDNFALVLKALFLLSGYVVVLLSTNEIEEGGYYQGEYYVLLLSSVLGMVMMASSRDLVSMFVALEFLSIPAYMMAAWKKRDRKSNEAGVKYYLLGVFASAVMLYGMSLLYGIAGSTLLTDIGKADHPRRRQAACRWSASCSSSSASPSRSVPCRSTQWAPDTYEGAPTPVTAFLSVASKAAGFVGLMVLATFGLPAGAGRVPPVHVGDGGADDDRRQRGGPEADQHRAHAGVLQRQPGWLHPDAAGGGVHQRQPGRSLRAVLVYLIIYAATNLGAFAVVIAVSRKTRSGEISSFGGLFTYAPASPCMMTIFLASLAGIPPLGGWYAKFGAFKAAVDAAGGWGYSIAIIAAVNAVIATAYYITIMREMWMKPVPDGDTTPIKVPAPLQAALAICGIATLVFGVLPGLIGKAGAITDLYGALSP
jgi:NADH-quinone oxidoreductase subunit N